MDLMKINFGKLFTPLGDSTQKKFPLKSSASTFQRRLPVQNWLFDLDESNLYHLFLNLKIKLISYLK